MRRAVLVLGLLSLSSVRTDDETEADETDSKELERALLDIDVPAAVSFFATFEGKAANILADTSINRWTERGGKPEVLGDQEVRGLLHKAGVGGDGPRSFVVRGELAKMATNVLDGDGDGKLNEQELQALLTVAECAAPGWKMKQSELEAEGRKLLDDSAAASLDRALAEVRKCDGAKLLWNVWSERLRAAEAAFLPSLRLPPAACEEELAKAVLPKGVPLSRAALRHVLKTHGVAPLVARHALATALLAAADADADGKLSVPELKKRIAIVCSAGRELLQLRGDSVAEAAAALLLDGDWNFARTADAGGVTELLRNRPLRALGVSEGEMTGLAFVHHAVRDARGKQEL